MRLSSFSFAIFSTLLLCVALPPEVAHSQTPTKGVTESELPQAVSKAFLTQLRSAGMRDEHLKGIRIVDFRIDKGRLVLWGIVDNEQQAAALKKEAAALVAVSPLLKDRVSAGVSIDEMASLPIRSAHLAKIQTAFASSRFAAEDVQSMLRRTRLDDAYFDESAGIVFSGICIDQNAHDVLSVNSKRADIPPHKIIIEIEDLLKSQITADRFLALRLTNNKVNIKFLADPVPKLQTAIAKESELDGVLVRSASFDKNGTLRLEGLVAAEAQRRLLQEFLADHFAESKLWRSSEEAPDVVANLNVFPFESWKSSIQESLSTAPQNDLQRTLLRRAWYSPTGDVEVAVGVIGLKEISDEYKDELRRYVEASSTRLAATIPQVNQQVRTIEIASIDAWESPVNLLREATAAIESLDGVRVDDVRFDRQGKIELRGISDSSDQQEEIVAMAKTALRVSKHALSDFGAIADGMKVVSTRTLLNDMRKWSAEHLDEFWLQRMYFDKDGKLAVTGFGIVQDDEQTCQAHLESVVAEHPISAHLMEIPIDRAVAISEVGPSLTEALRKESAKNKSLISIERGFYDAEGVFVITGVQDNEQQTELLNTTIKKFEKDLDWKDRVPRGLKVGRFAIVPMDDLMQFLEDVLPAFHEFDGLRLTGASYDAENRLTFQGSSSKKITENVKQSILELISADEDWKLRISAGISFEDVEVNDLIRGDTVELDHAAMESVKKGDTKAAIAELNVIIQLEPENSLAWYLRAACYSKDKKEFLANRDFYRVAEIEQRVGGRIEYRLHSLETFQGPLRGQSDRQVNFMKQRKLAKANAMRMFGLEAWKAWHKSQKTTSPPGR